MYYLFCWACTKGVHGNFVQRYAHFLLLRIPMMWDLYTNNMVSKDIYSMPMLFDR